MAQRIFAPAKVSAQPQSNLAPDAACVEATEQARASAYLDLWERQLRHAAALGPIAPRSPRKDAP